jgi:hypothetical protein
VLRDFRDMPVSFNNFRFTIEIIPIKGGSMKRRFKLQKQNASAFFKRDLLFRVQTLV